MELKEQVLTFQQMEHLRSLGIDTSDAGLVLIYKDEDGNECDPDLVCYNEETGTYFDVEDDLMLDLYPCFYDAENGDYDHSYKSDGQVYTHQEVLKKLPKEIAMNGKTYSFYVDYTKGGEFEIGYHSGFEYVNTFFEKDLFVAAYEMLCFLAENKFISKEVE